MSVQRRDIAMTRLLLTQGADPAKRDVASGVTSVMIVMPFAAKRACTPWRVTIASSLAMRSRSVSTTTRSKRACSSSAAATRTTTSRRV